MARLKVAVLGSVQPQARHVVAGDALQRGAARSEIERGQSEWLAQLLAEERAKLRPVTFSTSSATTKPAVIAW